MAAPDHPLAGSGTVSVRDLADETWLVREEASGTRRLVDEYLAAAHITPPVTTIGSNSAVAAAAMVGLGVGLVPLVSVEHQIASGQLVRLSVAMVRLDLEQHRSEIRHEIHRYQPAQHQCQHRHAKDGKGVFAGAGARNADGQEAHGSNQRAREHGHGGDFIGKRGGTHLVVALFHLAHHHFHRNDGVVHQQAQRNDQRAQ